MSELIRVKVIPKARISGVFVEGDLLKVKVHAAPEKGKANAAVIELLAEYFKVERSAIILVEGDTSRQKLFRIER